MKSHMIKVFLLLSVTVLFFVLSSCWSSDEETPTPLPTEPATIAPTQPPATNTMTAPTSTPLEAQPSSPVQNISPLQSISPLTLDTNIAVSSIAADSTINTVNKLGNIQRIINLDSIAQINLFKTGGMNKDDFLLIGPALLSEAKYEPAVDLYSNQIAADPTSAIGYQGRANVLTLLNRTDEALIDYTKAIELEPNAELYASRCEIYSTMHSFEKASADCNQALSIAPDNIQALVAVSRLYLRQKETSHARETIQKALSLEATPEAHYIAALIDLDEGDNESAIEHLSKSIQLDPQKPQYYWDRGMTYLGLGKIEECKKDLQSTIDVGNSAIDGELMFKAGSQLKFLTGN